MLLQRELDTRLLAVEQSLRRLAGNVVMEPPAASLDLLVIAGMSRPLALPEDGVDHSFVGALSAMRSLPRSLR